MRVTSITETITPEMAAAYLSTSEGNRTLCKKTVAAYAKSLENGDWVLNGDSITFDAEGHLLNGHHRLQAVIQSGVSMTTLVVRGVDKDAFRTYDIGRHRTLAQLLGMKGANNTTLIASAINVYSRIMRGHRVGAHNADKFYDSASLVAMDIYDSNKDVLRDISTLSRKLYQRCSILPESLISGIWFYLMCEKRYPSEVVEDFFENLLSYSTSKYDVIEKLRIILHKDKDSYRKKDTAEVYNLIVITWNRWRGTSKKAIKWQKEDGRQDFSSFNSHLNL